MLSTDKDQSMLETLTNAYRSVYPALITTLLLLATTPLAALHPNHPLGFDPERDNESSAIGIDSVDLFSGSLSLSIPIGRFTLNYSSNVWRYREILVDEEVKIESFPDRRVNAGLGWHLGWGEVYHWDHALNDTGRWLYIGPDGAHHVFYRTLHKDDDPALDSDEVFYTRDGSYLRMHQPNNFYVDITAPEGTTRRFDSGTGGLQSTYFLQKIWSPFSSAEDPDLLVEYDRETNGSIIGLERTVTDRHGRTHVVHFTDQYAHLTQVVTQVDLEGFAGQRMQYNFFYDYIPVNRSCKDDYTDNENRISIPHLREVTLPDGTAYSMKEGSELLYYNVCKNEQNVNIDDVTGVLKGIVLPNGGKIRWSFQEYEFPPGGTNSVFNTSAGVEHRRLLLANDAELGSWRYKTSTFSPGAGLDPEVHTEVSVLPEGDCTKHFFDARYWVTPSQTKGWEYGLPFVYSQSSGGRYLSTQTWTATAGNGSCSGEHLRSRYLQYRHDPPPGEAPSGTNGVTLADFYNTNRSVDAVRYVYHDDNDNYADLEESDYDGLGQSRRSIETGTFRLGTTTDERRETFMNYNTVSGTYPGSYQQPGPFDPWIFGIYDYTTITEDEALGESTMRIEAHFEPDTGFLTCTRVLASGTSRSANDLLAVHERDPLDPEGSRRDVKRYGGDTQTLSTAGTECGTVPSEPAYWDHHDYQFGKLVQTTPRHPDGTDGPFPTYDVDLDPSTGRIVGQRDRAGYETTFDYDDAGRLRSVIPQDGARVEYDYINAAAAMPSKRIVRFETNGGVEITRGETFYDDFGRPRLQRRLLPDDTFSERETNINGRGWTTSVSQWGDLAKVTEYHNFDPFGRAGTIRPPEGADHDVRITRLGEREVITEIKRMLAGGEAYVSRVIELDRYQRLRVLTELSGSSNPGPEATSTFYDYDVGGRVTRLRTGAGAVQTRSFTHDNRGFMLTETHPEVGATGNGTISYHDYDAAGLPHRKVNGPNDFGYTYDFIGRRITILDRNRGNRLLTHFRWDSAIGFGKGSLHYAMAYNYLDLPWNTTGEETVKVRQVFRFEGIGGSVSRKDTKVYWSLDDVNFRQSFAFDDLGNPTTLTYPRCVAPADCFNSPAGAVRTVGYTYTKGWLTAVPEWATQIDYLASGLPGSVHHANGVVDHFTPDPSFTRRPIRLHTTGVQPAADNFDTGTMLYDGAGSLTAIGNDSYAYDKAGRLALASLGGSGQQTYSYDRFGNRTGVFNNNTAAPLAVDSATNRFVTTPFIRYDQAGNLENYYQYAWRYDPFDRVVTQNHMRYVYDAFGERALSITNAGLGEQHIRFHLRDYGHRRMATFDKHNSTWTRDRDYVYASTRMLASSQAGAAEAEHFHLDHLGSTRLTTLASGSPKHAFSYLPYGHETSEIRDDSVLFTGHERDFSTGADYMHARHYHAELGRFLSIDQNRGGFGQPQSHNRYAYVSGNPVNDFDPNGKDGAARIAIDEGARRVLAGDRRRTGYWQDRTLQKYGTLAVVGGATYSLAWLWGAEAAAAVATAIWKNALWGGGLAAATSAGKTKLTDGGDYSNVIPDALDGFFKGAALGGLDKIKSDKIKRIASATGDLYIVGPILQRKEEKKPADPTPAGDAPPGDTPPTSPTDPFPGMPSPGIPFCQAPAYLCAGDGDFDLFPLHKEPCVPVDRYQ